MPQVTRTNEGEPEMVPVFRTGVLRLVLCVLPVVGVGYRLGRVGKTDDEGQILFHSGQIEVHCCQIGKQRIVGEVEVVLRLCRHRNDLPIDVMSVRGHDCPGPSGREVEVWVPGEDCILHQRFPSDEFAIAGDFTSIIRGQKVSPGFCLRDT